MEGYLEPECEHVGIIRLGPVAFELGDDFKWSALARYGSPPLIKALSQKTGRQHFRAVGRVLWKAGFRGFKFYRSRENTFEPHEFEILDATGRLRRTGHTVSGSCVTDAEIEPPQRQPMADKKLHILGGDIIVVGVDGTFRNQFGGPNGFGVNEADYINVVQPEYNAFLKSLLKLDELPKPAEGEGRVHVLQNDTFVIEAGTSVLYQHIKGAKYIGLYNSVFLALERELIASQERLNAAAKAGFAASQAPATAAA